MLKRLLKEPTRFNESTTDCSEHLANNIDAPAEYFIPFQIKRKLFHVEKIVKRTNKIL